MFTEAFKDLSNFDKLSTISLFVTILIIFFASVLFFVVKKKNPEKLRMVGMLLVGVAVGYSIAVISLLTSSKLIEYKEAGYLEDVFSIKTIEEAIHSPTQLYLWTILIITLILFGAFFVGKKIGDKEKSRSIVYAAICIALSFALSYVRFFELPKGGSVTFASLLPLMLYSYIFGIRKGVFAGVIYGFLQFIQAPWFFHPVQFFLDYPIAFCAIGLTGILGEVKIFSNNRFLQFAIGGVISVIIRYLAHVVSGIFVFGSADPDNYGAVAWSFLYNLFSFADMGIAILGGGILFSNRSFRGVIEQLFQTVRENSGNDSVKLKEEEKQI